MKRIIHINYIALFVLIGLLLGSFYSLHAKAIYYHKDGNKRLCDYSIKIPTKHRMGTLTILSDPDHPNFTIKIYKAIPGEEKEKFISRLIGSEQQTSVDIPASIGDVFTFEIAKHPKIDIAPFRVKEGDRKHVLSLKVLFQDAPTGISRIPNTLANLSSFDVFHMNPLLISQSRRKGGGLMNQVFEGLGGLDYDWKYVPGYGDYAIKKSLKFTSLNVGRGTSRTELVYSGQSFSESFGLDLGLSGGVAGFSGSLSVGFQKSLGGASESQQVIAYSKKQSAIYSLDLIPEYAKLTPEFIEAVEELPIPKDKEMPTNKDQAKKVKGYKKYEKFIEDWGSHYAKSVTYGGFIFIYEKTTMENFINNTESGFNIKQESEATINGIELGTSKGFNYKKSSDSGKKNEYTTTGHVYVGGNGSQENWAVGNDNMEPIKLTLDRLDNLLTNKFFTLGGLSNTLKNQKIMLGFALDNYLKENDGNPAYPRVFNFKIDNWQLLTNPYGAGDEVNLYGNVETFCFSKIDNTPKVIKNLVPWSRSEEPGSRVLARQGYKEPLTGTFSHVVEPENGRMPDLSSYSFGINASFYIWHATGKHTCVGTDTRVVSFVNLTDNPNGPFVLTLGNKKCNDSDYSNARDGWSIQVNGTAYEETFESLGFDFFPDMN